VCNPLARAAAAGPPQAQPEDGAWSRSSRLTEVSFSEGAALLD